MNLLTAYRTAKKSQWKPAIDGKTEKEESKGKKKSWRLFRRYSDEFNAAVLLERAIARALRYNAYARYTRDTSWISVRASSHASTKHLA